MPKFASGLLGVKVNTYNMNSSISPIPTGFFNPISETMIDEFAIFGFIGGIVGYAWYLWSNRHDPQNHMSLVAGIYGVFLSGCLGALLAIVFDRKIELSIIVGLTNQLIYMIIIRSVKKGEFWKSLRAILLNLLRGGLVK